MKPVNRGLKLGLVVLTLIAASLIVYLGQTAPPIVIGGSQQPGLATVTKVVDGDTIEIDQSGYLDTVRLIGVDTPETHDPRKSVQCYGEAAAGFTTKLLQGQKVRLAADPTNNDRDKYQRLLRYIYLPDGQLVNATIISQGYGFAYTDFPFTKKAEFVDLEAQAHNQGLGLWSHCRIDASHSRKQTVYP